MRMSQFCWKLFELTGYISAYMVYRLCYNVNDDAEASTVLHVPGPGMGGRD